MATSTAARPSKKERNASTVLRKLVDPIPKPDDRGFRSREEAERAKIQAIREKMDAAGAAIRERMSEKDELQARFNEHKQKRDEIRETIRKLEDERRLLSDKAADINEEQRQKRTKASNMRKELCAHTEEEIEDQLIALELHLASHSLNLAAEKEIVAKLSALRKMKPQVRQYIALEDEIRTSDTKLMDDSKSRMQVIQSELQPLRQRRLKEEERLDALAKERQRATAPIQELRESRNELQQQMHACRRELTKIRHEREAAAEAYEAYLRKLKQSRLEQDREKLKREELENRIRRLEERIENSNSHVSDGPTGSRVEQTLNYVKGLIANQHVDPSSPASPSSGTLPEISRTAAEEGFDVVVPKSMRQQECLIAPSSKKKNRAQRKVAVSMRRGAGPLTHDISVLADFTHLGVDPPLLTSELEGALAALTALYEQERLDDVKRREEDASRLEELLQQLAEAKNTLEDLQSGSATANSSGLVTPVAEAEVEEVAETN